MRQVSWQLPQWVTLRHYYVRRSDSSLTIDHTDSLRPAAFTSISNTLLRIANTESSTGMSNRRKGFGDFAIDVFLVAGVVCQISVLSIHYFGIQDWLEQVATSIYLGRIFLSSLENTLATDPERERNELVRSKARDHLRRLRRKAGDERGTIAGDASETDDRLQRGVEVESMTLNEYESLIAMEMVAPEDIPVRFDGKRPSYHVFHVYSRLWWTHADNRHRRLRRCHRGNQGVCDISTDNAGFIFTCRPPSGSPVRCPG